MTTASMMPRGRNAPPQRWRWIAPLLVVIAGTIVYGGAFHGPFIFDDMAAIRSLEPNPPAQPTAIAGRPVLRLTFALDYAIGGKNVEIYHLTNFLIHLGAGLLLYGIIRRNLARRESWGDRFAGSSSWLASAVAVAWIVHPLDTQSVTYIVQRAESLAGCLLLAVIYCLIRAAERPGKCWAILAVIASALGMASKEIVAAAPILALLYDRAFLSGSLAESLRRRGKLYAALAATWVFIGVSLLTGRRGEMVGFNHGISAIDYARTELGVIAQYLWLAIRPVNLVLDYYDWPIARHWSDVGWQGWMVAGLIAGTGLALWKRPWVGFLGAWFFLILAPTSSFLPILYEAIAEQRMYLPLAALIAIAVIGGWKLLGRWRLGRVLAITAWGAWVIWLGCLSIARNAQFSTPETIWRDNIAKRPNDPRGYFNLGYTLAQATLDMPAGSPDVRQIAREAAEQFRRALSLRPDLMPAVSALGNSLVQAGDLREAERFYTECITKYPALVARAHLERGKLRARRGDWKDAREDFLAAQAARPDDADAFYYLGLLVEGLGNSAAAKTEYEMVLRRRPDHAEARLRLEAIEKEAPSRPTTGTGKD